MDDQLVNYGVSMDVSLSHLDCKVMIEVLSICLFGCGIVCQSYNKNYKNLFA